MSKELVERILQQYGLKPLAVREAQKGYRNYSYAADLADGRTVNLILYKKEQGILEKIRCANRMGDYLASQGFPARRTADSRITKIALSPSVKGQTLERYAGIYGYLPGTTIPWEVYTMEHIKQLGKAMSDMHFALRSLPQKDLPFVASECLTLLTRMEKYFTEDGARQALGAKLSLAVLDAPDLRTALTAAADLPGQALHMDFVRSNILFDENQKARISGILDFEKTAWGPPVFDIARTLAFLLVDCKYKEEVKVRKYFLHSGYNKRGQSSFNPNLLLENLINFFLMHDFYKFLRHNPYESLANNEHFMRTRDFLLRRGILRRV